MATLKEAPTKTSRFERLGSHTHIKGLGLDKNLKAVKVKDGMVGQEKVREAAGLVVRMIKEGKLNGKTDFGWSSGNWQDCHRCGYI